MGVVARHLLGEPNKALSSVGELRYGSHGSLKINLAQGLFHDFETDEKGGVSKLIQTRTGTPAAGVPQWLKRELGIDIKEGTSQIVATYPYTDEAGDLLYEV